MVLTPRFTSPAHPVEVILFFTHLVRGILFSPIASVFPFGKKWCTYCLKLALKNTSVAGRCGIFFLRVKTGEMSGSVDKMYHWLAFICFGSLSQPCYPGSHFASKLLRCEQTEAVLIGNL